MPVKVKQIDDDFFSDTVPSQLKQQQKVAENYMWKMHGYKNDFEMKNDARPKPGKSVVSVV